MANWFVTTKRADFQLMAEHFQISPILARILRNRDLQTDEEITRFLHGNLSDLYDPHLMKDIDEAAKRILAAIKNQERIRVIGDYDIDGVCASYILLTGLKRCGAVADVKLPDRIKDGYGISCEMIDQAHLDQIQMIITCDNGIAADEQIAHANELGIQVIVTDHHEVPYELNDKGEKHYLLPPAKCVVDPHREDCTYPYQGICGAVVVYKLIEVLYQFAGVQALDQDAFLEFAAIATVGDIMELREENRIIVKYGIERIRNTKNIGLRALIDSTGINRDQLTPFHIGYIIGPCINATGRLDSAERALSLFRTQNMAEAAETAAELKALNDSRKDMTKKYQDLAFSQAEQMLSTDRVLVIYLPDCHESLAGIIAGRVRERFYRPTFVLTRTGEGVKGSGRSIDAYHMYDEMTACKELFLKYGGHKLAAGLSMKEENIDILRSRLNEHTTLTEEDMQEKVQIDIAMPVSYATKELIREISMLEPFGTGNPKPLFAEKNLHIISMNIVGRNQNVVKLKLESKDHTRVEAIWFGAGKVFQEDMEKNGQSTAKLAIVYTPELNTYMGKESVQIHILHYIFL